MTALIILLAIWEVYWTYQACWLASKLDQKKWFLFFLVFNLLGVPEMIYLKKQGQKLLRRP